MKIRGDYFIDNGRLLPVAEWTKPDLPDGFTVYEVLRVIDGVPVFLDEHLERMLTSFRLAGNLEACEVETLKRGAIRLTHANGLAYINLRMELYYDASGNLHSYMLFLAERAYPTAAMYRRGVNTETIRAERKNPNAKILRHDMKARAEQIVQEKQLHDVLYVNANNRITEGSRTNIFFVRQGTLYTAPETDVLKGITRQKVLQLCTQEAIPIVFEAIAPEAVADYEAAFFSGTSPKVLPVRHIDDVRLEPSHPLIIRIMGLYNRMIEENIRQTRQTYLKWYQHE